MKTLTEEEIVRKRATGKLLSKVESLAREEMPADSKALILLSQIISTLSQKKEERDIEKPILAMLEEVREMVKRSMTEDKESTRELLAALKKANQDRPAGWQMKVRRNGDGMIESVDFVATKFQ